MNRVILALVLFVSLLFFAAQVSASSSFLSSSNNPFLVAYVINPFNVSMSTSDHNALTNLQWSLSGHTIDTNLSSSYWVNAFGMNSSVVQSNWFCNATECTTNLGGGGGGGGPETDPVWTAIKPSYMPYAYWNSTNITYALNATLNNLMWNTTNSSYGLNTTFASVAWNITNESYVQWVYLNGSYMLYQYWNSTNATYDALIGVSNGEPNSTIGFYNYTAGNFSVRINDTMKAYVDAMDLLFNNSVSNWLDGNPYGYLTGYDETDPVWTIDKPSYMPYAYWNSTNTTYALNTTLSSVAWNITNESYVSWFKWNITNSSYDTLLRTAMLYSAWNSTNTSYALNTTLSTVAWNQTNVSYALNTTLSTVAWNQTNTTYPAINATSWLNEKFYNASKVQTQNITIGNSGSSTIWNNGTWSIWM